MEDTATPTPTVVALTFAKDMHAFSVQYARQVVDTVIMTPTAVATHLPQLALAFFALAKHVFRNARHVEDIVTMIRIAVAVTFAVVLPVGRAATCVKLNMAVVPERMIVVNRGTVFRINVIKVR